MRHDRSFQLFFDFFSPFCQHLKKKYERRPARKTTTTTTTVYHTNIQPIMSHEGQEELLDYSDSEEIAVSTTTQASGEAQSNDKESDKRILCWYPCHRFQRLLLKPELLRAIGDCGFEHPSEGM